MAYEDELSDDVAYRNSRQRGYANSTQSAQDMAYAERVAALEEEKKKRALEAATIAQAQQISASKKMEEFLKFDCILKLGNPGNFNKRVFNSFSDGTTLHPVDRFTYRPYVDGTLPGVPLNVTLLNSETHNSEAWKPLQIPSTNPPLAINA